MENIMGGAVGLGILELASVGCRSLRFLGAKLVLLEWL